MQELNDNLLDSIAEPTPADQMDFLRQKINSHQGTVGGDFANALEGSAPQESDKLMIECIDYLERFQIISQTFPTLKLVSFAI